ncbi:MAG: T9SS type A sorting domain-containing protein [Saprospiraceae bacterium]|nr:T9SS type A sorting domain-containing protein [Saprospiraceae bacterium]
MSILTMMGLADVVRGQGSFCGEAPFHQATSTHPDSIYYDRFGNSYDLYSNGQNFPVSTTTVQAAYFTLVFSDDYSQEEIDLCATVFTEISNLISQRQLTNSCGSPISNSNIIIEFKTVESFPEDPEVIATGTPFFYPWTGFPCFIPNTSLISHSSVYLKLNGINFQNHIYVPFDGQIVLNRNFNYFSNYPMNCPSSLIDLYTVIMHEAMHIIAFHPRISEPNYITDYDLLFKENGTSILNNNCGSSCYTSSFAGCNATTGECDLTIGSQNNAVSTIAHLEGSNNLMHESFEMGSRKFIQPNEVQILCDIGLNTTNCPNSPFAVPNYFAHAFTRSCSEYSGCCSNSYHYCKGESPTISFNDLLCFVHSSSSVSVFDVSSSFFTVNLTPNSVQIQNPNNFIDGKIFVQYKMDLPNNNCKIFGLDYSVYFDPTCYCEFTPLDECNNVLCYNNFNNLPNGNNFLFGYPFYFENTPYGCNNTPDIFDVIFPSQGNVVNLGAENEALVFKLDQAPYQACQLELLMDIGNNYVNTGNSIVEIWGIEYPPCDINDRGINRICGVPTTCGDGTIFESVCLGEFPVSYTPTQMLPFNLDLDMSEINVPVNYLMLISKSGSIQFDNIAVRVVNCATNSDFTTIIDPCNEVLVIPTETNNHQTHVWDFGDGNISTEQFPLVHTYGFNGTYTITHTVQDNCGNLKESNKKIIINCPEPSSSCTNQSGCISIGTDINSVTFLSNLVSGANPVLPYTSWYGAHNIENLCISLQGTLIIDVQQVFFTNTTWYCGPGSTIQINDFGAWGSHWFIESELTACDVMWKGIVLSGSNYSPYNIFGSGIGLRGTTIRDAYKAIEAGNGRAIFAENSNFIDNYISVYVAPGQLKTISTGFQSCLFESTDNMLQAYPNQPEWNARSLAGISVSDLTLLLVETNSVMQNRFINLSTGIIANKSNLSVSGALFEDTEFFHSTGIMVSNAGAVTEIFNSNLSNLEIGVNLDQGLSSQIRIRNNTFYSRRLQFYDSNGDLFPKGVYLQNHAQSRLILSEHNRFDYLEGVGLHVNTNLSEMTVTDNDFFTEGQRFRSIWLIGVRNKSIVTKNEFRFNLLTAYQDRCVAVHNCSLIDFIDNEFFSATNSLGSRMFELRGTSKCLFRKNIIPNNPLGFTVFSSSDNGYCCNDVSFSSTIPSFVFVGESLASLRQNNLNGLLLQGNIGKQLNAGNIWTGAGNWAQLSNGTIEVAQANQFIVDALIGSTPQSIQPTIIATEWFRQVGFSRTCLQVPDCGITPYNISPDSNPDPTINPDPEPDPIGDPVRPDCHQILAQYYDGIAFAESPDNLYPDQTRYVYTMFLLDNIDKYGPFFWADCSIPWNDLIDLIDWHESEKEKDNIIRISRVRLNTVDSLVSQIQSNIEMIGQSPFDGDTISNSLLDQYHQLWIQYDEWYRIASEIKDSEILNAQNFILNTLSLPDVFEFMKERKVVWEIYGKILANGKDQITSTEWEELRVIAQMCPFEKGQAVFEAQSILSSTMNEYYESDPDIHCAEPTPRNKKSENVNVVLVQPNPSSGIVSVEIPSSFNATRFVVFNSMGIEILNKPLLENNNTLIHIDFQNEISGIYFFSVYSEKTKIANGKFQILK